MLTLLLRFKNSHFTKTKDFSPYLSKYVYYDELINDFDKAGTQLSTKTMQRFLMGAIPKITRQQNYSNKLTTIFKTCVPHFAQNFTFYKENYMFSRILLIYQSLNLHRKQIFDLVEKSKPSLDDLRNKHSWLFYFAMVDLHHKQNLQLKKKFKDHLFKELSHENYVQRNPYERNHLLFSIKILNSMLMDHDLNLQQCQALVTSIENNILPTVKNVSLIQKDVAKNLALAKQLIQFHKLNIKSDQFYQLLDSAIIFFIEQKMQLSKPIARKQNYNISFNEGKAMEVGGSKTGQNYNFTQHGISSIFETIFSRCLDQLGYDYERNIFVGMFEYDFLIKGKKSKKYHPFENIGQQKQFKPISKEDWQVFKGMNDFQSIKINEEWQQPMIVNLNGPYHYIDSDVYGNERVTRTDEIKMMLLKNYGYKRFNEVYYADWEQVHEKGVHIEEFIKELVSKNMAFKK